MVTSMLVLGAGFGGLELPSRPSSALGGEVGVGVEVARIGRRDGFVRLSTAGQVFGTVTPPSTALAADEAPLGGCRRARWLGLAPGPEPAG